MQTLEAMRIGDLVGDVADSAEVPGGGVVAGVTIAAQAIDRPARRSAR